MRIAFARALQVLGWPGVVGVVLVAVAIVTGQRAWTARLALSDAVVAARTGRHAPAPPVVAPTMMPAGLKLQPREAIPLLLTRIERAATGSGLPWSSGDYRLFPATGAQAAFLEVRCAFKAPYPKLRSMVGDLLRTIPAMTFREMSFSRQTIDAEDVDAKFTIIVFLADDGAAPRSRGER